MSAPASSSKTEGPPRARLTFRVGIVGHRPNRLPKDAARLAQLRHTLHTILSETRQAVLAMAQTPLAALYAAEGPRLRAISPLAEGADRIFAEEALALGYELCCPMPFAQAEFEKDFAPDVALEADSLSHFHGLLARARATGGLTIFEMDGERVHAPDAYWDASRVLLNQTDLLIGVWDGGEPAGRGGTVESLQDAIKFHVPAIRIDALAPEHWTFLNPPEDSPKQDSLAHTIAQIVRAELDLPLQPGADSPCPAPGYFRERKPGPTLAWLWKIFRDLVVSGKFSPSSNSAKDFEAQVADEWPVTGAPDATVPEWVNSRLRAHFAWADGLADYYADQYRSAFVMSYLLSATAVFLAGLDLSLGLEITSTFLDSICLLGLLILLRLGRSRHWHERWMEYRLLAELIRELRFLIPLGGGKPLPRSPAHLAIYGDPARTWMYWHMRAIARQIGIPAARVTPGYVHECLDFLSLVVGDQTHGQMGFHARSEMRARLLDERLRRIVFGLFAITFFTVLIRFILSLAASSGILGSHAPRGFLSTPGNLNAWLILAAGALPALSAALAGISNQGEFVRVRKRSAAMVSGFARYHKEIIALKRKAPRLTDVILLSRRIAEAMVDEVVDWRAVFIDRPQ